MIRFNDADRGNRSKLICLGSLKYQAKFGDNPLNSAIMRESENE